MNDRTAYPSDIADDEWAFVAPYLTLMTPDAPQRHYDLREVFNLALHVTPANEQDRAQVGLLAEAVQDVTGEHVELAFVDQGYTGEAAAEAAAEYGIELHVVKLEEAKQGFVLLPRRWVAERAFAWKSRFRRLVRDYERLPETVAGLHFVAFSCLMLHQIVSLLIAGP